jgi:uncharacterized protein YndB with AHSA1/START domain
MTHENADNGTRTSRVIDAPREAVYRAFTDPGALSAWRAPGDMTATMHDFDLRVGGGYSMSLFYTEANQTNVGKTAAREDRYTSRFVALQPPSRIVEAITFDTDQPGFSGEMIMEVTLQDADGRTEVTMAFHNLPPGIRPEDNDAGTRLSLEKLARYLETDPAAGASDTSDR